MTMAATVVYLDAGRHIYEIFSGDKVVVVKQTSRLYSSLETLPLDHAVAEYRLKYSTRCRLIV